MKIWMAVERHQEASDPRKEAARKSWLEIAKRGVTICELWDYPRNAAKDLGDKRALPYLKDVIENAMKQAQDDDIVFVTNDDIYLHPKLPEILRFHVPVYGPVCSQRCEFIRKPFPPQNATPETFAALSHTHPGRDLFAFTKKWLVEHWAEIPDTIIAASEWDFLMCCLIRLQYGIRTNSKNIQQCIYPCELPRGYLSHTYHQPMWQNPNVINRAPSQHHNRRLMREFTEKHKLDIWYDRHNCPLWNRDTPPEPKNERATV